MNLLTLYERVFSALAKGGGVRAIIEAAYEVMQMPISLHDAAFNLLAVAPREKIGDFFWDLCLELGAFPPEIIMLFYDQGFMEAAQKIREPYYVDWGDCAELPRIQGVVRINDVVEGYITIFCPKEIYTPEYEQATRMLVSACAIEMERSNIRNLSKNPLLKVFMHDLIRKKVDTQEKLDLWRQRLPASFKGDFRVYAIETPVPNIKAVQKYLLEVMTAAHSDQIEMVEDNTLYVLLYGLNHKSTALSMEDVRNKMRSLQAKLGISDRFSDIMQFDVFRKQAEAALEMGGLINAEECVFHYRDYRFPFIMHAMAKQMNEDSILAPGIRLLEEYDGNYGTNYLETLKHYVLENRNIKTVLTKLGIHRNTLLYRLQKIEELLSVSLQDAGTFVHFYISFYIMKMNRVRYGKDDRANEMSPRLQGGSAF
jgi:sugar diacid utilization regulator